MKTKVIQFSNVYFFLPFFFLNFFVLSDPTNRMFGLKYPFFVMVFIFAIIYTLVSKNNKLHILHLLFVLFLLVLAVYSRLLPEIRKDIQYDKTDMYMPGALLYITLLFPVLLNRKIYFLSFQVCLVILLFASYFLYFLLLLNNSSLIQELIVSDIIFWGFRDWGLFTLPMIYIKSCVLLVFVYPLCCGKEVKHWLFVCIAVTFGLILSGTRANMIGAISLFLYTLYIHLEKRKKKYMLFLMLVVGIILLPKIIEILLNSFFSADEKSMNIKTGHLKSYIDLFLENPSIFLFGSGTGALFYSVGSNALRSITELTYFESIRVFGIILCIPLGCFLLLPLVKLTGLLRMSYLMYLFIMGTNPLLYSSTGMTAIVFIYANLKNRNYR